MKTWTLCLILSMLLLAGCYPNNTNTPANFSVVPTLTKHPLQTSTLSPTIQPTIAISPTLTPNFPLSECPTGNSELEPDFTEQLSAEFPRLGEPILEFLNSGGTPQAVIDSLSWTEQKGLAPDWAYDSSIETKNEFNQSHLFEKDVTGDGVAELIVSRVNLYIFGCRNEKYDILLELKNDDWINRVASPWIVLTDDLNSNNAPELIIKSYYGKTDTAFCVFEWQEDKFANLLISETASGYFSTPDIVALPIGDVVVDDFDKNGTKDLAFRGFELFTNGLPSRGEQYIYSWNGSNYIFTVKEYSKPIYRFEAVQDGDRYSLAGNYDKAISSYQDAVFSDKLDWWSSERNRYEVNCWATKPNCVDFPTPPNPDPKEYFNLAAYSRFRLMVVNILRGWQSDAEVIYNELQKQYPTGQTGSAYAEMASEFWLEYQLSGNVGQACNRAIEYASTHPTDILSYLGNSDYSLTYYGEQSLRYTAQDICPFK